MSEREKLLKSIRDKIVAGVPLAFEKMWEEARLTNREMVFCDKDGKIVKMRARDVK
jgi:hypothetical protein